MKIIITENQKIKLLRSLSAIDGLMKPSLKEIYEYPELFSDYEFDEINVKDGNLFFNGIKNLTNQTNKYIGLDKDENVINWIKLKDKTNTFEIPESLLKKTKNNNLYMSIKDFQKIYPDHLLITADYKLSDIATMIKYNPKYKNLIGIILKELYEGKKININGQSVEMYGKSKDENCETNVGVINYRGVKYGKNFNLISNWSILNFFNTNTKVIEYLLNLYKEEVNVRLSDFKLNFESEETKFLNWVYKNKVELFSPSSSHLDTLEKLNLLTLTTGIAREQKAIEILVNFSGLPEGSITEYCPGSIDDTIYGRDIKVVFNGMTHFYQIKPLINDMKIENGKYIIQTTGMKFYPMKNVDLIMFLNDKGKFYIFENNNYIVEKGGYKVEFSNPPINTPTF